MPRPRLDIPVLAAFFALGALPGTARAEAGATLGGWSASIWDRLTDREGNLRREECHPDLRDRAWGNAAPETEAFRRWDPALLPARPECVPYLRMLERAYAPFLAEERAWIRGGDGMMLEIGSWSAELLLTRIELAKTVPLTPNLALEVNYQREHDLTAARDLWRLGFSQQIGGGARAFVIGQIHFFKPELDLEVGGSWLSEDGRWRARAGLAWLDTFSDFNFFLIDQRDRTAVDVFVRQGTPKLAGRLDVEGTVGIVRGELHAGGAAPHVSRLSFPNHAFAPFRQAEEAVWAGALAEVRFLPRTAAGVWAAFARTRTLRVAGPGAEPNGRLVEEESRLALFASAEPLSALFFEGYVERVWRPERGGGSMRQGNRNETETAMVADLLVRPSEVVGLLVGFVRSDWQVRDRDPLVKVNRGEVHDALRTRVELRFGERTWFRFGANWGRPIFQGGSLIFYSRW